MKVSDFLTSFFSIHCSGSKPRTSPAIWQVKALASNFVIRPMPERPSTSPFHVGSLPTPRGEIIPIPVTTTRRLLMRIRESARVGTREIRGSFPEWHGPGRPVPDGLRSFGALVDVLDGVPDLLDLLGLVVGDLDAELLLEGHDQLDRIERVRSKVLDKRRFRVHFVGIDAELLDDD